MEVIHILLCSFPWTKLFILWRKIAQSLRIMRNALLQTSDIEDDGKLVFKEMPYNGYVVFSGGKFMLFIYFYVKLIINTYGSISTVQSTPPKRSKRKQKNRTPKTEFTHAQTCKNGAFFFTGKQVVYKTSSCKVKDYLADL